MGKLKHNNHLNFHFLILLREIDRGCRGPVSIILMGSGVLGDVLDAALGGHDDTMEDDDIEAPEADGGLVRASPSWSGTSESRRCVRYHWLECVSGSCDWLSLL